MGWTEMTLHKSIEAAIMEGGVVSWFSCGAASTASTILAAKMYPNLRVVNNPVAEEHEDNIRYMHDVEKLIGIKIEVAKNFLFPDNSAESVWRKRKFMSGVRGKQKGFAPCTDELKKESRRTWEDLNSFDGHHVFGFTIEEKRRHARRVEEGMKIIPVLIDAGMTKQDCFEMVKKTGIKLPAVYSTGSRFGTGYPNANCIGCVKATSPTYWNHVRETFPEVFKARAELSREIGCKLTRYKGQRIFLDELPPDARGRSMKTMKVECGITCGKE